MSRKRFTEEFKIEAVRQITERGFAVRDVGDRLGVSPHSLYTWIKQYGIPAEKRVQQQDQSAQVKRLQAQLKRVTEERDILKKAAVSSIDKCNTIRVNRQEVLYGKDGSAWIVRSGKIRTVASMAGWAKPIRHRYGAW